MATYNVWFEHEDTFAKRMAAIARECAGADVVGFQEVTDGGGRDAWCAARFRRASASCWAMDPFCSSRSRRIAARSAALAAGARASA